MEEQPARAPRKEKAPAARKAAPDSSKLDPFHALAYIPFPGRVPGKRRDLRALFALIAAGALAGAAYYFLPAQGRPPIEAAAAPERAAPELPKIDAVVVDHYNAMIRRQRRPDLLSDKVQFINGVYSVVPNSWGPDRAAPPPPDSKR